MCVTRATGSLAAKGKIPYAILSLMDTLRHHPGQARFSPSKSALQAVMHTEVMPERPKPTIGRGSRCRTWTPSSRRRTSPACCGSSPGGKALPPPVFGYNSHPRFVDVPFPDYSYWGHEYHRLLGAHAPPRAHAYDAGRCAGP